MKKWKKRVRRVTHSIDINYIAKKLTKQCPYTKYTCANILSTTKISFFGIRIENSGKKTQFYSIRTRNMIVFKALLHENINVTQRQDLTRAGSRVLSCKINYDQNAY